MHSKHRIALGNGYRSDSMGTRGPTTSRNMSGGSMKGHRVYNNEKRGSNHGGYGHGRKFSRQFHPQPHPPEEIDIFVEAGKLAAEYLVSKGVLPPNALSGRWRNDALMNQATDFGEFRQHEYLRIPIDASESTRRRHFDECNSTALRSLTRGRVGSFKNYELEMNKESGGSGSFDERSKASPIMVADNDVTESHNEEHPVGKDSNGEIQAMSPSEITQESGSASPLDSKLRKCNSVGDDGTKSSSNNEECLRSDGNEENTNESDDIKKSNVDMVEGERNDNHSEQKHEENKLATFTGPDSLDNIDIVKCCKFDDVPIEIHNEQVPVNEDIIAEGELSPSSRTSVDVVNASSAGNSSFQLNYHSKSPQADVLHALDIGKELDAEHSTMTGESSKHGSFPEEQEPDKEPTRFGSPNHIFKEKGEKRVIDSDIDSREGFKKLRECSSSMDVQSDDCPPLSSPMKNQPNLNEERSSALSHATLFPGQKDFNISQFPDHTELPEFMQEKKLFPSSFKTCDLNLIGNFDATENCDVDRALSSTSLSEVQKEASLVDLHLSMRNNVNLPQRLGINDSGVEVIDLENDSYAEDQTFMNPERRDNIFTDLDGFSNNVHDEISDIQQGYGHMISELLGNDNTNPSSVCTNVNSSHSGIDLPNEEGILGDDDSIYMSLEEIPISFLRAWDQPTQDYGKRF